jgi:hypothetical protein
LSICSPSIFIGENLGSNLDYIFSNLTSIHKIYSSSPEVISNFEEIINEIHNQEQRSNLDSREKLKVKKRLRESLKSEGFDSTTNENITLFLDKNYLVKTKKPLLKINKLLSLILKGSTYCSESISDR